MIKLTRIVLSIAGLAVAGQALAIPIVESGDAGDTLGTAQVLPGGTTSVTGTIDSAIDADLYQFDWGGGAITIDTLGSVFDTQLFLFDALGNGLYSNDDGGPGLLSMITDVALAAGTYFIGISDYDFDPQDVGNNQIFPDSPFSTQFGPNSGVGGLHHWGGNSGNAGAYTINISSVPEPGTLGLLGLGLLGLFGRRRKI